MQSAKRHVRDNHTFKNQAEDTNTEHYMGSAGRSHSFLEHGCDRKLRKPLFLVGGFYAIPSKEATYSQGCLYSVHHAEGLLTSQKISASIENRGFQP